MLPGGINSVGIGIKFFATLRPGNENNLRVGFAQRVTGSAQKEECRRRMTEDNPRKESFKALNRILN
jgi:hypothetical protein